MVSGSSNLRHLDTPIARLIDGICTRNRVSITQLARLVDVDHSYISRVRAGDRLPSRELVVLMLERWPLTESEIVGLCTHFRFIPDGYRIVPNGAIAELEMAIGKWAIAAVGGTR